MKHLLYPYDKTTTEEVATALGRLLKIAKKSTEVSLEKSLFMMLETRKIGTLRIEAQAFDLLEDGKKERISSRKKVKGRKLKLIIENRDPEKVGDLLKLKVKYCLEVETKIQKDYRRQVQKRNRRGLQKGRKREEVQQDDKENSKGHRHHVEERQERDRREGKVV